VKEQRLHLTLILQNQIMGWYEGEDIEVFNFSKVCRMDNRWSSYEIHQNQTEIIIEITNL